MNNTNQPTLAGLRARLDSARDDLHTLVFSEAPTITIVQQQAKVRALKGAITRLGNKLAIQRNPAGLPVAISVRF